MIVVFTGSVALLADTIHNVGDAATAIPLWIAFRLAQRKPSRRFTYSYGRVEDLAGVLIVLIILFSAADAAYEFVDRFLHPQPVSHLALVAAAAGIGFLGNEAVAQFRIKIGTEIGSAALVADGQHARVDGLTSLAVLLGAVGVWLGFPLADPVVGLGIALAILRIVWDSGKSIFTRLLDGVDPDVVDEIRHAVEHAQGVRGVSEVRVRWSGHRRCSTSPWTRNYRSRRGMKSQRKFATNSCTTCGISPMPRSISIRRMPRESLIINDHEHGDLPAHSH